MTEMENLNALWDSHQHVLELQKQAEEAAGSRDSFVLGAIEDGFSQRQIADYLNLTPQRVGQIAKKARERAE